MTCPGDTCDGGLDSQPPFLTGNDHGDHDVSMAVRLGELLLREKRITPTQLQEALNHQKANGGKLGMTLVKLGMVKDEEITALLSRQYGVIDGALDTAYHKRIQSDRRA